MYTCQAQMHTHMLTINHLSVSCSVLMSLLIEFRCHRPKMNCIYEVANPSSQLDFNQWPEFGAISLSPSLIQLLSGSIPKHLPTILSIFSSSIMPSDSPHLAPHLSRPHAPANPRRRFWSIIPYFPFPSHPVTGQGLRLTVHFIKSFNPQKQQSLCVCMYSRPICVCAPTRMQPLGHYVISLGHIWC